MIDVYKGKRFNNITHLVGAALAFVGWCGTRKLRGDEWRLEAGRLFSVYGATLFLLHIVSTLYHSIPGAANRVFRILDHQVIYLVMGWLCVLALEPIVAALPPAGSLWLIAGGLFYTTGIVFYILDHWFPWSHGAWHLFMLAGSVSHFFAIPLLY